MKNRMFNRVIVTGSNSLYFGALINLLGSIFLRYPDVDAILVYDLGMSSIERTILKGIRKILLKQVPEFCPHYLEIQHFAWKTAAICDALSYGNSVLWLDAGAEIQSSLEDLFLTIENDGYLFSSTPLDSPNCRIGNLSLQKSLKLLGADNEFIRNSFMVNAGVIGFLRGHSASDIAYRAMEFAANPEIIKGPRATHRHDQTIYSVLRVKNGYHTQYHMFHLERIQTYPFLMRASQPGIISFDEISSWERSVLHIYLSITRDREPFSHVENLCWGGIPFITRYLLWLRRNEIQYRLKNWLAKFPYLQQIARQFKQKGCD